MNEKRVVLMYQYPDYLMHYGIPGMKWGVRKQRVTSGKTNRRSAKNSMSDADKKARRRRNIKIAAGVAGGVAAAALATYGTYKFSKFVGLTNYKYHEELGQKKVKQFAENYDRLVDTQLTRSSKQALKKYTSGQNTLGQLQYKNKNNERVYNMRKYASAHIPLKTNNYMLNKDAETLAGKVTKKKIDIYNREIGKASTDTFGQAVKNTATYYKSHKRKRR